MKHKLKYIFLLFIILTACNREQSEFHQRASVDTLQLLTSSPTETVVSSQRTVEPKLVSEANIATVTLNGYIVADERISNIVSARIAGRIEKLYAKYYYQFIEKGSSLMEIYSPELNTIVEEHLILLKKNNNKTLLEKSRKKMMLLGLKESQIDDIEKKGIKFNTVPVFSPYSGFLLPSKNEDTNSTPISKNNDVMNSMESKNKNKPLISTGILREGSYVTEGQALFILNKLHQLWGMLVINEAVNLNVGDEALIKINGKKSKSKIDFIESYFEQGQQFNRVRLAIDNHSGEYKLNDVFTVEFFNKHNDKFMVPKQSVLDLGLRKIIWVKTGTTGISSVFQSRIVTIGQTVGESVEIISGLKEGEQIAESAGFMIDSESLINK